MGGACVQQVYGMTELSGAIAHDVAGVKPRPESAGTRNPMVELAILAGGELHTGPWPSPVGELLTSGPQVFPGYVEQEADRGSLPSGLAPHRGYLPDRRRRIHLHHGPRQGCDHPRRAQYRSALDRGCRAGFPGVALAAAVGRPDTYAGEVPMLFVSAQPGVSIDPQALADYVQEKIIEPPARPKAVAIIAEMPVTAIGKIFKPKLREIAAGEAARDLLTAEGLAKEVSVEAITDPLRGLYLQVKASADKDKAVAAGRLLQKFPVKVEVKA